MKTAIVIGVGPERGLGAQLCTRFAGEGLKVIVAGRTLSALEVVVRDIESSGGQANPLVADATRESDIVALFDAAGDELDLAIYNARNNTPIISRRLGASSALAASCLGARRFAAFNSAKARLRALAQAMAKEYAGDGIHVAHVVVDGPIGGNKIMTHFLDAANREDSLISIEGIVDAFAILYGQPERTWSFELDVRTSNEKW
jgi:NAD(P)-dependent dehydrogenase (short-subunit alcohol dehydrogenase family)